MFNPNLPHCTKLVFWSKSGGGSQLQTVMRLPFCLVYCMWAWLCVHVHTGPLVFVRICACEISQLLVYVISESVPCMFLPVSLWVIHPQAALWQSVGLAYLPLCLCLCCLSHLSICLCGWKQQGAMFCWAGVIGGSQTLTPAHTHTQYNNTDKLLLWCLVFCPYGCLSISSLNIVLFCRFLSAKQVF